MITLMHARIASFCRRLLGEASKPRASPCLHYRIHEEGRENANIDAGWRFIWRISARQSQGSAYRKKGQYPCRG
jgi:hypothetical protein